MFLDTGFLRSDEIVLRLDHTVEGNDALNWVPAYHFIICAPDGTPMGKCDLRVGHNSNTYYGGNIGYEIFESYRGHHYAGKACRLLFELAKAHSMRHVYITCQPDNLPSSKTCEYAGGQLLGVKPIPEDNDMYKRGEREIMIYQIML